MKRLSKSIGATTTSRGATGAPACRTLADRRGRLSLHLFFVVMFAFGATAGSQDLVDAARENKARRKKSTTKVLTNADVKKAKSKIVETKVPAAPVVREPTLMEKHVAAKAVKADTDAKRAATEELIGELEIELAAIEQRYYEENDLNRRDTEIVKRFNDVKKRLDEARAALATLP